MRTLTRRRALTGTVGVLLLAGVGAPQTAEADLWGGDLGLLAQILTQVLAEVAQLASMISELVTMINLMKTELSALDSGSFWALLSFIQTAQMSYNALTGGVQSMAYGIGQVNADFHKLFPRDTTGTPFAQHDAYYNQWNQEVLAASEIAARQQTVLSTLDDHATQADRVLQQSQNASGEVAQLQTIVQMLRLMETELVTINQSLATTGRVLTDLAAAEASARQLSRTKKQSSLTNYRDRGTPVVVPHKLP